MDHDIILNKALIIERCLKRIHEEYLNDPRNLENFTKQDSIILNIQRAGEAAIDLAMHVVAQLGLGLPKSSREAFELLERNGLIDSSMMTKMKAMVGFRNIAVHDYQEINLIIVREIIENHLEDLVAFKSKMINEFIE